MERCFSPVAERRLHGLPREALVASPKDTSANPSQALPGGVEEGPCWRGKFAAAQFFWYVTGIPVCARLATAPVFERAMQIKFGHQPYEILSSLRVFRYNSLCIVVSEGLRLADTMVVFLSLIVSGSITWWVCDRTPARCSAFI
jgi:hypothetical protein